MEQGEHGGVHEGKKQDTGENNQGDLGSREHETWWGTGR